MAGIFLDGFSYYPTSAITRKWDAIVGSPTIQSAVVRHGPNALLCNPAEEVQKFTPDITSWVIGFGFRIEGFSTLHRILQFRDEPGGTQCSLLIRQDGKFEIVRGISGAVTGGVSTFTLSASTWVHVEMILTLSNSIPAGSCVVRVNEVDIITVATGEDLTTAASTIANVIKLGLSNVGGEVAYFSDFRIQDQSGGVNDTFLGDSRVAPLFANANGTTNQFTGSDGNSVDNFLLVKETDTDDDTTFVESDTVGHIDLYNFTPMPAADTIHMVQVNGVVRKDDAGSRTVRLVTRPASTNFFSASKSPDAGYGNESHLYDVSPETASAWTKAELDGSQFGVEIET